MRGPWSHIWKILVAYDGSGRVLRAIFGAFGVIFGVPGAIFGFSSTVKGVCGAMFESSGTI